jgi:hypothetical protein
MSYTNEDTRSIGANALLGIKRSASKQDLQSILDDLGSVDNSKTITPEFDSSILTPSMMGRNDGNMRTVTSTDSMSQFLGQTYSLPPPGQLQMMYASSVASAPSINSNR